MPEDKTRNGQPAVARQKFTVYIDPRLKKAIKIAAIEDGFSASDLVTRAVERYLTERKAMKTPAPRTEA